MSEKNNDDQQKFSADIVQIGSHYSIQFDVNFTKALATKDVEIKRLMGIIIEMNTELVRLQVKLFEATGERDYGTMYRKKCTRCKKIWDELREYTPLCPSCAAPTELMTSFGPPYYDDKGNIADGALRYEGGE